MSETAEHDRFNAEHRMREKLKAKSMLAKMGVQEPLVERWEARLDLPGRDAEFWRERFAASYRQIVGVHPLQREVLRTELAELSKYGDVSVADAVRKIDRLPIHSKGDSSAVAAGPGNALPPLPVVSADDNPFA